jgi:sucrose-6-phosphate hydrolase SacC (GH32 family)
MADTGKDTEKPMFHVAPIQGWVNDPNGKEC